MVSKQLTPGIYVPVLTFFDDSKQQKVDHALFEKHVSLCLAGGAKGIIVLGSTGERVALSGEENIAIIKTARKAIDAFGQSDRLLIAGAGSHSTVDSIRLVNAAADAGADYSLVLPPSYYPAFYGGEKGLKDFYVDLAAEAKIPIIIYSYPGVCSGIDMSSDLIHSIFKASSNVAGIKHTDHNVGKIARVVAQNPNVIVLAGATDYGVGAWAVGAHGAITGAANIVPKVIVRMFDLFQAGKLEEARALQAKVAVAEDILGQGGVPVFKFLVQKAYGYGGVPRRPLQPTPEAFRAQASEVWNELIEMEKSL